MRGREIALPSGALEMAVAIVCFCDCKVKIMEVAFSIEPPSLNLLTSQFEGLGVELSYEGSAGL
jgi:hypothetical protein